jgi:hypothetical protein
MPAEAGAQAQAGNPASGIQPTARGRHTHPATASLSPEQLGIVGEEGAVSLTAAMTEALAQVNRPHQVRWALNGDLAIPAILAPRLAHVVAELIDAATARNPALVVLVTARHQGGALAVTVSDRSNVTASQAPGNRARAINAIVARIGGTLVARPGPGGRGTDAMLTVPLL